MPQTLPNSYSMIRYSNQDDIWACPKSHLLDKHPIQSHHMLNWHFPMGMVLKITPHLNHWLNRCVERIANKYVALTTFSQIRSMNVPTCRWSEFITAMVSFNHIIFCIDAIDFYRVICFIINRWFYVVQFSRLFNENKRFNQLPYRVTIRFTHF